MSENIENALHAVRKNGKWYVSGGSVTVVGEALPDVTEEDEGKVLTVKDGIAVWDEHICDEAVLPEITEDDNGGFTQVVDNKLVYTPPSAILGNGGTYTLYAASWADGVLIGSFGVGERDAIFFTPATRADKTAMEDANIFISTNDQNWQIVTFEAETTPTVDIVLKYFIVRGW